MTYGPDRYRLFKYHHSQPHKAFSEVRSSENSSYIRLAGLASGRQGRHAVAARDAARPSSRRARDPVDPAALRSLLRRVHPVERSARRGVQGARCGLSLASCAQEASGRCQSAFRRKVCFLSRSMAFERYDAALPDVQSLPGSS